MPDAPQPDWRATETNPSAGAGGAKAWQASEGDPSGPSVAPSKRNIKRTVAILAVLLLAIFIGIVVYWLRPIKPSCVILVGSGYEQNLFLPHNACGWNGLRQLEQEVTQSDSFKDGFRLPWDQPTSMRRGGLTEMKEQSWKDAWKDIRRKIDEGPRKENTVVLFLSLHGMADDKEAYLLPNLASPSSPQAFEQARIPFREVLDSLQGVTNKKIVLLLDVAQVQSHGPTGMLHNDFVARLKKEYAAKIEAVPNLVVICSTDADQRSWASDEMQNTVFGHYVTQALKGDEHVQGSNVSAGSLFAYVAKKVDTWAQTNRARKQTPILLGGESRAAGMALVHIADPYTAPVFLGTSLDVDGVKGEWDKWQKLAREQAPQVHNPHLWRLYQDTLLRYEQLMRAGDPTGKAASLKGSLKDLHDKVSESRALTGAFPSLGNSFPLHRVLGFNAPADATDAVLQEFLGKLDSTAENAEERTKVLNQFRDKSLQEKQYVRTRLSQLILKGLQRKSGRERELERLLEIETALVAPRRPVEAQLLRMLQDADRELDHASVQMALSVRAVAEEAAVSALGDNDLAGATELYAEAIFPWIKDEVEAGDKLRREGEDLLFGNPKEHAFKARAKLKESQVHYEKARTKARALQGALALRDQVSAELPYLASWLASARPLNDQHKEEIQALRKSALDLGAGLAALNRALDIAGGGVIPSPDLVAPVAVNLKSIQEGLQSTSDRLKTAASQQRNWHALESALSVPPAGTRDEDILLRKNLFRKLRDISTDLLDNKNPEGKVEEEDPLEQRVKTHREMLGAGLRTFTEIAGQEPENLAERVRDFYLKLPVEILAKSDILASDDDLLKAASWCRAIPAGLVDQVKDDAKKRINPLDRHRRMRVHGLLHWLAERTLADHWFEPGQAKEDPYYDRIGKDYLASARALFSDDQIPDALLKNADRVKKRFVPTHLRLAKLDDKLQWTTETDLSVPYAVLADKGLPEGTPMVWLEVTNGKITEKIWPRKAMTAWPKFDGAFPLDSSGFTGDSDVIVNLHAYYRGQLVRETSPSVRSQPDVIVRQGPGLKENTRVAVRMDSTFDYGAISIVLDNSGSMKYRYPKKGDKDDYANRKDERRRFDVALDALEHVLRKVPDNTHVSLFTLGDKQNRKPARFPLSTPWQQQKWGPLRASLEEVPADIGSPIALGILKSMDEGFPEKEFKGPKVVLVLTDGDDNASFLDENDDRTKKIVDELKAANAKHPDIVVVVVCFIDKAVDEKEFQSAKAQFGGVVQFKQPGHFLDVADGDRLGATIEDLLRPRVQLLQLAEQSPLVGFQIGHPINYHNDRALNWKTTEPGDFNAHVLRTSANPLVNVQIQPGQKMFMVVHRSDEILSLKRGLLALQPEVAKRGAFRKEKEGWLVSLLENENMGLKTSVLKQLLVFEKQESEKDRIRQPVPGLTWLELDAQTGARPDKTLRWGNDGNVPAPALRLEMREWPADSQPKVTAWFWPEERDKFRAKTDLITRMARPLPFEQKFNPDAADLPVVEHVGWKEREIEGPAGERIKRDCLVVRVRHAKGKPVWVNLEDRPAGIGSEHHFFFGARSSTSYFYGLAKPSNVNLELVDLEAFKKAAQRVEFSPDVRIEAPRLFVPETR